MQEDILKQIGCYTAGYPQYRLDFLDQFADDLGLHAMRIELQLQGNLDVALPPHVHGNAPSAVNAYTDGGLTHPSCPQFGLGTAGGLLAIAITR